MAMAMACAKGSLDVQSLLFWGMFDLFHSIVLFYVLFAHVLNSSGFNHRWLVATFVKGSDAPHRDLPLERETWIHCI